jgi:hypothetical protein
MGRHGGLFIYLEIQTMINAGFVDFLFTGAAIVPEVLFFAGYVGEAILLLVPMLIAACLISMYHDQVVADGPADAGDTTAVEHETGKA